jgi:hypothetical protein
MSSTPHEHRIHSSTSDKNQDPNGPGGKALEQHLFTTSSGAIVETDAIIHLGSEGLSNRVVKQAAFSDASNMHIMGGFFGAGSPSVAKEIAANHLRRQMAQDSAIMNLELRRLELAERRLEFERGVYECIFSKFAIGADIESRRETIFHEQQFKFYITSEQFILLTDMGA